MPTKTPGIATMIRMSQDEMLKFAVFFVTGRIGMVLMFFFFVQLSTKLCMDDTHTGQNLVVIHFVGFFFVFFWHFFLFFPWFF